MVKYETKIIYVIIEPRDHNQIDFNDFYDRNNALGTCEILEEISTVSYDIIVVGFCRFAIIFYELIHSRI